MILKALTIFQIESASCLLPPDVPSFWLYAFVVLSFSLLTLGVTATGVVLLDWRGRTTAADRLEFFLTVAFATLFVYALQVVSAVMRTQGTLSRPALGLAIPLLLLLAVLGRRFWNKVHAYRRGAIEGKGWRAAGWCTADATPHEHAPPMHV